MSYITLVEQHYSTVLHAIVLMQVTYEVTCMAHGMIRYFKVAEIPIEEVR